MAKMNVSDSTLVEQIRLGEEDALAALYDRYAGMLYAVLLRILKDSGAAEEVLQDLFLQVWRAAGRFDASRGTLAAWLLVIGRSRALSRLRLRKRHEIQEDAGTFSFEAVPSLRNLEDEVVRMEFGERVRHALTTLPQPQREALELAYYQGMSHMEIAVRTGNPLGTVKSRVRAAIRTLQELFEDPSTLKCCLATPRGSAASTSRRR